MNSRKLYRPRYLVCMCHLRPLRQVRSRRGRQAHHLRPSRLLLLLESLCQIHQRYLQNRLLLNRQYPEVCGRQRRQSYTNHLPANQQHKHRRRRQRRRRYHLQNYRQLDLLYHPMHGKSHRRRHRRHRHR